jgi:hypothetical protein
LLCEECGKGGFPESCYYDRDDKHITRDPDCDVHEWRSGK